MIIPNKLSAVLITYNEKDNIENCIENLSFCDEIIVVDSYSTDGTYEYLEQQPGLRIYQRKFKNFTDQKTFALKLARFDWVFFPDADELTTPKLKQEILRETAKKNNPVVAYWCYKKFLFKGKPLRFSGWQTDKNYRLFRKDKVHFSSDRIVHETLEVNGPSAILKNHLLHFSYKSYHDYRKKMLSYGRLRAMEEQKKGVKPGFFHFYLRPFWKFCNHYFLRLGILDGYRGIVVCYLNALGVSERYRVLKQLLLVDGQKIRKRKAQLVEEV